MILTFNDYLTAKKIDANSFAKAEAERFREFYDLFNQVHPESFTAQKLFLINQIRRKYPLPLVKTDPVITEDETKPAPKKAKPVVKKAASNDYNQNNTGSKPKIRPKINPK